jgi:hypothetical protein
MSQQKVSNTKTVVISGSVYDAKSISSFDRRIDVPFTPDVMIVKHIGLINQVTDSKQNNENFITIKSTLHKDPLGSVFAVGGYNPESLFKLGHDVSNTYTFTLYDASGNIQTFTQAGIFALTLEFIKYVDSVKL